MMNRNDESFKILIVDDNIELRTILEEYLSSEGNSVEGSSDGKEALRKYNKTHFDLIITDLNMPGMPGIELIKEIKKQNDITEFIIITGYASLDSAVEAVKIGAFDYIVKPFRMEEISVVVKNAKDKIVLKKSNMELFKKLKNFYNELEKYKQKNVSKTEEGEVGDHTERIVSEIKSLEKLVKGRLLID